MNSLQPPYYKLGAAYKNSFVYIMECKANFTQKEQPHTIYLTQSSDRND